MLSISSCKVFPVLGHVSTCDKVCDKELDVRRLKLQSLTICLDIDVAWISREI